MVTLETLEIINVDLEKNRAEDLRPGSAELLTKPSKAMNLNLKIEQNEREVHLPEEIEAKHLRPSTSNVIPINVRKAWQPSDSNSEDSNVKAEESEQVKAFEKCMNFFRFFAFLLGIRIRYDWKPQRHVLFYSTCFNLFLCGFLISYTVYIYWINHTYIRILEPLAISGIFISCVLKLHGFLRHRQQLFAVVFCVRKYCNLNIGRQAEILKSSLRKTWSFLLIYATGVAAAICFVVFTPIVVYLTKNDLMPLLPIEVVFCDQSQTLGFFGATIVHLILGCYSSIATATYGAAMIFCISNYTFQVNLVAEDFQELDGMWNGRNNMKVAYKHAFLKNICKKRQDMNNYLGIVKQIFQTKLFIYFCSNYFSQIICLFDITQNGWIGGYGFALELFMEMMFYCYMGTQVSIVDDKLCYTIYNCNWYSYDAVSKRMILILLHECQKSKDLQLGPIGPLNLVTGITIVKSIYTYYTVLTEMF